jgi:hypothetical protein
VKQMLPARDVDLTLMWCFLATMPILGPPAGPPQRLRPPLPLFKMGKWRTREEKG